VFSFTHEKIAEALIKAHERGVKVRVLADARQERQIKTSRHSDLRDAGIEIIPGPRRRSWHNKIIVIDGRTVITGSANFTHAAQYRNHENVVIIRDNRSIARHYRDYWKRLAATVSAK
jgi:phosphatidylserine/phosphatidylglycerophosphate/cardiolipin synthase-like enzyme